MARNTYGHVSRVAQFNLRVMHVVPLCRSACCCVCAFASNLYIVNINFASLCFRCCDKTTNQNF